MGMMEEEHPGLFTWAVVDTTTSEGLARLRVLRRSAGGHVPVPSILVDGTVLFDAVPDLEDLDEWMSANLSAPGHGPTRGKASPERREADEPAHDRPWPDQPAPNRPVAGPPLPDEPPARKEPAA